MEYVRPISRIFSDSAFRFTLAVPRCTAATDDGRYAKGCLNPLLGAWTVKPTHHDLSQNRTGVIDSGFAKNRIDFFWQSGYKRNMRANRSSNLFWILIVIANLSSTILLLLPPVLAAHSLLATRTFFLLAPLCAAATPIVLCLCLCGLFAAFADLRPHTHLLAGLITAFEVSVMISLLIRFHYGAWFDARLTECFASRLNRNHEVPILTNWFQVLNNEFIKGAVKNGQTITNIPAPIKRLFSPRDRRPVVVVSGSDEALEWMDIHVGGGAYWWGVSISRGPDPSPFSRLAKHTTRASANVICFVGD